MPKQSAGLLIYRTRANRLEFFLVHPGGPFWAKKEAAAWSIPKGEFADDEDPLAAALREFSEETGLPTPSGPYLPLGTLRQPGGKVLHVWAVAGECDPARIASNTFQLEWPPRSGRFADFPEVDRAAWCDADVAAEKLHKGQVPLLAKFQEATGNSVSPT